MELEKMLTQANNELLLAEGDLRKARKRVDDLRKIVDGIKGLQAPAAANQAATDPAPVRPPKPKDAVQRAMESSPGKSFAPKEVVAQVKAMGLYNENLDSGATAYTTALGRLAVDESTGISKDAAGWYRFDANNKLSH